MDKIYIQGGKRLTGRVRTSGSKNSTVAIMAGAILAEEPVTLRNVPRITDTHTMVELLNSLGAPTRWLDESSVLIDASNILWTEAPYELVRKMRASFHVLGPLLARFGHSRVPVPGGCNIGARPVNYHIEGLKRFGAQMHLDHGVYTAEAPKLHGANIYFDSQSPGATEHLMTAAALAHGTTVMENCATEPEVVDLANFLNTLGARVKGAGTTTLTIHGVGRLHGGEYTVISDRMEAATFAVAAAITGGDVVIDNINMDHLKPVTSKLLEAGVELTEGKHGLHVRANGRTRAVDIRTVPYPGFPTDMQQPFAALLSVADGTSVITETIYENRFGYVNELVRMGANVTAEGRTAVIKGVERLTGAEVLATDLRAGAALLCAGLAAEGETEMSGIQHLDRGYENVVTKLQALGATISRGKDGDRGGTRVCSL